MNAVLNAQPVRSGQLAVPHDCIHLSSLSAVDLLEKMLDLDADRRLNAEQALAHPYLATYADPEDEVITVTNSIFLAGDFILRVSFPVYSDGVQF